MNEMKIMKKTLIILMAVALVALPTMAQQNWRTRQTTYGSHYQTHRTTAPSATYHSGTFHSTSTYRNNSMYHSANRGGMMSSGSAYSARPIWNRNGIASTPTSSSGSRRARKGGLIDWDDGENVDPENPGDYTGNLEPGDPGYDSSGGNVFDPDPNDEDDAPNGMGTPLGDAMLPLMLCAFAYLGMRVFLRRKRV